jgi:23S rRNA pseudouridine2604 synthase
MNEPLRLSKRVAALVPCSRSEAEQYIEGGWVRVDGAVIEEPQHRVSEQQQVEVDSSATLEKPQAASFLLHKPAGATDAEALRLLVPANRVADDASGIRPLKKHLERLEPLLALPRPASGLAVFSQDFRIVRKLNEDARTTEQELIADVSGTIAPNGLARLCHGLVFERDPLPPAKVSWQSETRLRFAVKGIAPWVIPWMCEQVGLQLQALRRIRIGRVPLAGLAPGQWRYLYPGERF